MWYPSVEVGAHVREGQNIGRIGNLYGDTLARSARLTTAWCSSSPVPAMPHDGLMTAVGGT